MGKWKSGDKKTQFHLEAIPLIGVENTLKLLSHFGGRNVWIPEPTAFLTFRRDIKIYKEYKSKKYSRAQLADRWGMSYLTIWRIVSHMKELEAKNKELVK